MSPGNLIPDHWALSAVSLYVLCGLSSAIPSSKKLTHQGSHPGLPAIYSSESPSSSSLPWSLDLLFPLTRRLSPQISTWLNSLFHSSHCSDVTLTGRSSLSPLPTKNHPLACREGGPVGSLVPAMPTLYHHYIRMDLSPLLDPQTLWGRGGRARALKVVMVSTAWDWMDQISLPCGSKSKTS